MKRVNGVEWYFGRPARFLCNILEVGKERILVMNIVLWFAILRLYSLGKNLKGSFCFSYLLNHERYPFS